MKEMNSFGSLFDVSGGGDGFVGGANAPLKI